LDHTKQAPVDALYNYIVDQSPTRENYEDYRKIEKKPEEKDVGKKEDPIIGQYNNDAGIFGGGVLFPAGGFIYD
jgi:hypothetical protein